MEKFLKRLMELRGKEELTEDEKQELAAKEQKLKRSLETSAEETGGQRDVTEDVLEGFMSRLEKTFKQSTENEEQEREIIPEEREKLDILGENVHPWRQRTVRYFGALSLMKDSETEAHAAVRKLKKDLEQAPDNQFLEEEKRALEVIDKAPITNFQKSRVRYVVGVEERLHTTSTTDTPKAGYLLPKPFLAEVFVILEQYGIARRLLRGVPMSSKSTDLKNVATKVVAAWITEGNRITADDLVLAEGQLEVEKLAGLTSWTTELEEDMAIALLPLLSDQFAESIAKKEDEAALLGDGTAAYGNMTGIVNLTNVQQYDMGAGDTAASALEEADLRAAKNQLSEARQQGARWIMHRTVWDHITQLENTAGFRIVQENLTSQAPRQLLGLPVELSEVMPSLTGAAAGTPFIILGNPSRSLMGMRRGLTADISREAVIADASGAITFNAFQMDGALLRLTERVGFKTPSAYEDAFATIATAAA